MRSKVRLAAVVVFAAALVGCSMTPEGPQSEPDVDTQAFAASYEVVFKRVLSAATACFTLHNSAGSYMVPSGEIHRDRGYADFRLAAGSVGY
jgi:hypothetical protein